VSRIPRLRPASRSGVTQLKAIVKSRYPFNVDGSRAARACVSLGTAVSRYVRLEAPLRLRSEGLPAGLGLTEAWWPSDDRRSSLSLKEPSCPLACLQPSSIHPTSLPRGSWPATASRPPARTAATCGASGSGALTTSCHRWPSAGRTWSCTCGTSKRGAVQVRGHRRARCDQPDHGGDPAAGAVGGAAPHGAAPAGVRGRG